MPLPLVEHYPQKLRGHFHLPGPQIHFPFPFYDLNSILHGKQEKSGDNSIVVCVTKGICTSMLILPLEQID